MDIKRLQEIYNEIDSCSVKIDGEVDFNYIQLTISKTALYIERTNSLIAELLIEKSRLEHRLNDLESDYEINYSDHLINNADVKQYTTGKERKEYINYLLMTDIMEIKTVKQELKDVETLLKLVEKKSRDLDKMYPKLKTLWDSVDKELRYLKKIGSDAAYMDKVRDLIKHDKESTPVFTDAVVDSFKDSENDLTEQLELKSDSAEKPLESEKEIFQENADNQIADVESLLADL